MSGIEDQDQEIVHEFVVESHEGLDQLDQDLIELEAAPRDTDLLSGIFRTFHTIKGSAGFLALHRLESIAHVAENLLSRLRDGEIELTTERAGALLSTVDVLRAILVSLEESGAEGEGDDSALLRSLEALLVDNAPPVARTTQGASHEIAFDTSKDGEAARAASDGGVESSLSLASGTEPRLQAEGMSENSVDDAAAANEDAGAGRDQRAEPDRRREKPDFSGPEEESASAQDPPRSQISSSQARTAESSIRIDVTLLDSLMNLVGELVLTRNQIVQHITSEQATDLNATAQRLSLITSDLQEGVMKTRMQPIRNIWSKYPRVIRDLTQACGKKAIIRMEGQETELDRTILEAIKDPLTHMLRNSVDHGIEACEDRRAEGKPEEGEIFLHAYHEGGHVNIEMRDDGRGIDLRSVRKKAVERGLCVADRADRLSDREVLQLIFQPGFSTAERVTNVSGRGVGMDVVRTQIEKIGGTVDLSSQLGKGTTIRIKIPLTLAIIPALLVTAGAARYAIPQVSLIELVRLEGADSHDAVDTIRGTPVYRLRGNLLPLVDLRHSLGLPDAEKLEDEHLATLNIVVLQANETQFGLIVDEVWDTEEIVVKPLSQQIRDIMVFAGATILGDGRVSLILDSVGLAERAGILDSGHTNAQRISAADLAETDGATQHLLLLDLDEKRAAIPLSAVSRLEEIPTERIEVGGGYLVTQYRDEIIRLVPLSGSPNSIEEIRAACKESLQVVVHSDHGCTVGLVVERIHDIVTERIRVQENTRRSGTLGCAVVQGRVTDLLDVPSIIERCHVDRREEPICA